MVGDIEFVNQAYFEFYEWEKAFALYYAEWGKHETLIFCLSTHWATSGYWIETKEPELREYETDYFYRNLDEVKALEARIRERGEEVAYFDACNKPVRRKDCINLGGLVT